MEHKDVQRECYNVMQVIASKVLIYEVISIETDGVKKGQNYPRQKIGKIGDPAPRFSIP